MSAKIQAATDFRVKYSRRVYSDGRDGQHNEVEILNDGPQHPDVELQEADDSTQKKLTAVKKSCLRAFKVSLGVLYLLTLAGITTRYILVTLEKEQLENRNNQMSNNYSQSQEKCFVNKRKLQRSYDALSENYSQLQAKLTVMAVNNSQLQEEVKKLKNKMETMTQYKTQYNTRKSPEEWMRFGSSSYFKSTEMKPWFESRRDCQRRGGDLVIINSEEEQKFVNELNMRGESWIGLQALKKRISRFVFKWEWQWVNGSPLTEKFWAPGQQDPSQDYNAICCDNSGKWTKGYGSKTWICEK